MSAQTSLKVIILTSTLLAAVSLWGSEPLSEQELDRTIASGYEPGLTVVGTTAGPNTAGSPQPSSEGPSDSKEEVATEADSQSSEAEFSLVAYRSVLPIVMKRMTSANNGPLAANGNYSLSPVIGTPVRPTVMPTIDLKLIPRVSPSRPVFFGR